MQACMHGSSKLQDATSVCAWPGYILRAAHPSKASSLVQGSENPKCCQQEVSKDPTADLSQQHLGARSSDFGGSLQPAVQLLTPQTSERHPHTPASPRSIHLAGASAFELRTASLPQVKAITARRPGTSGIAAGVAFAAAGRAELRA